MTESNKQNNLTAAKIDNKIYLCINGRGSFQNSPSLKKFVKKQLANKSIEEIILNMEKCSGMDSTFMGVLAGLACISNKHTFYLINISDKNEQLLKTLGVSKILNYYKSSHTKSNLEIFKNQKPIDTTIDKKTLTYTSLEAHKKLIEIKSKNKAEFKSVIELLEEDIKNIENG